MSTLTEYIITLLSIPHHHLNTFSQLPNHSSSFSIKGIMIVTKHNDVKGILLSGLLVLLTSSTLALEEGTNTVAVLTAQQQPG